MARFAWFVVAYTVGVILWGAYVRATGSGAGCGSHWPSCHGEILPRAPEIATLIEFSHRVTSGLALLLVVALLVLTLVRTGRGHPARLGAWMSVLFMLIEAGIGAGLVLFELVADNASMARALFMAVHLLNTFVLLAWMTLTACWLAGADPVLRLSRRPGAWLAFGLGLGALLLAGASGAVAALGDTLFPSGSLAEALRADFSATSHVLIRLRILHPVLAVAAGIIVVLAVWRHARAPDRRQRVAARLVIATTVAQLAAGFVNVLLLAPIWLQILHLLLADVIWVAFVVVAASALAVPARAGARAPGLAPARDHPVTLDPLAP